MATAPTEIWKSNPLQGDFNPGSKIGKDIFIEKSKGLADDKRIEWKKSSATKLHSYFRARENKMDACIQVPTEFNADGTVKTTKNLLSQYHSIKLTECQRAAQGRYATALAVADPLPAHPFTAKVLDPATNNADKKQFYAKVHSNVVAKIIENGLTPSGFEDLLMKKHLFEFRNATTGEIEFDGPTMLYLVYEKIDPDTIVGLDSIEDKLESSKLGDHGNDVDAMLTAMEALYKTLKDNGRPPRKYRKLLLDALITGPNSSFNAFVQRIIDDIESGIGAMASVTADDVIVASRTRYNNMLTKDLWKKVDPRDAQIMALAT